MAIGDWRSGAGTFGVRGAGERVEFQSWRIWLNTFMKE